MKNVADGNQTQLIVSAYKKYAEQLNLYFVKYTHDMMLAEDMTQNLFIKLLDYSDIIVEKTAKSFVYTAASRMILDDARHKAFIRNSLNRLHDNMSVEDSFSAQNRLEMEQIECFERTKMASLPKQRAKVYEMSRFYGKSTDEIALEMHLSPRTVECHLLLSRKEIREYLKKIM